MRRYKSEDGKTFCQYRPDPTQPGEWIPGMDGVSRVWYNLPQVLAAVERDEPIYIVEGEKCAEAMINAGYVATTIPQGASSWKAEWIESYCEAVEGATVILMPDNDDPGKKLMSEIAEHLYAYAATVKILILPKLAPKGDVADWLKRPFNDPEQIGRWGNMLPEWTPYRNPKFVFLPPRTTPIPFCKEAITETWNATLEPIRYIVSEFLPEGLTVFAGRPKKGKSWLSSGLALAVGAGGMALGGYETQSQDVLYLALEDNQRRMQSRLKDILQQGDDAPSDRIDLLYQAPKLDEGLMGHLQEWVDSKDNPGLIIVDTLAKVRPAASRRNPNPYDDDYDTMTQLHDFAVQNGIAVIAVLHTRKAGADDIMETIMGTTGISGGADTLMVLRRDQGEKQARLLISGRDIEEQELHLEFNRGLWLTTDAPVSESRQSLLNAIIEHGAPMSPKELAAMLDRQAGTVRQQCARMSQKGELIQIGIGLYDVAPSLKASITLKQPPTVSLVIEPEIAPVEVPCSNGVTGVTPAMLVTESLSTTLEANPGDEVAPTVDRYATEEVETEEGIETEDVVEDIAETAAAEEIEDFIACEDTVEETLVSAEAADKIPRVTPQVVESLTVSPSRDSVTPVTPFAPEVALPTCPDCDGHEFFPGTRRDICKRCLNF